MTISPPQKHYKIVFIKAPQPPAVVVPDIPIQPADEEKTLVYVLVKKPDDPPNIVIPTPPSTQPSKPEVYFIRYKAQVNINTTVLRTWQINQTLCNSRKKKVLVHTLQAMEMATETLAVLIRPVTTTEIVRH